jgi:hypothetical protein
MATVKVPPRGRLREERVVTLILSGEGEWEVFDEKDQPLGFVSKGHYTYSPLLHRGSPVARYHRRVACWQTSLSNRRHWPTRIDALAALLTEEQA